MALVVLMGLLLFLVPFIKEIDRIQTNIKKDSYLEIQIGKIQLENEIKDFTFKKIENNKVYFRNTENKQVIVEQYDTMIRKTVGHQPIVHGVKTVLFSERSGVIRMEILSCDNQTYTYFIPCKTE